MTKEIDPYPFNSIQNHLDRKGIGLQTMNPPVKKMISTLGYRQKGAEEHLKRLIQQGFQIIDIRTRAGSRYNPAYNWGQLKARFGDRYTHFRELGNRNYPHKPYELANEQAGINKAAALLLLADVPGVILLCACQDAHECHRSLVAELLQQRISNAQVIHLEEA